MSKKYKQEILAILEYDSGVYDQYTYKRKYISIQFEKDYELYKDLKLPIIVNRNSWGLDMEDTLRIKEFVSMLDIYRNFPSPFIKIYPPKIIKEFIYKCKLDALDKIVEKKNKKKLCYKIPLCYSKHYNNYNESDRYINVLLCVLNIYLKEETDKTNTQFLVVKLHVQNLRNKMECSYALKKYINEVNFGITNMKSFAEEMALLENKENDESENDETETSENEQEEKPRKKMFEMTYEESDLSSFGECLDELMKNQHFTM